MDWKRSFLESVILGQSTDKNDSVAVMKKCIELAYRDMMTAGRYYSKSFLHSKTEICSFVYTLLEDNQYQFSRKMINDTALKICDGSIGIRNHFVTGYGLAQKIINMTFKYLYVFDEFIFTDNTMPDFSSCDCPLDSIILEKAGLKSYTWSKLNEEDYVYCQNRIVDLLKTSQDQELSNLGAMAFDFMNWQIQKH